MTLFDRCAAGLCMDPDCWTHGCKAKRGHHMAIIPTMQHGCVCPPTSEQTCQNPLCPRKDHSVKINAINTGGRDG